LTSRTRRVADLFSGQSHCGDDARQGAGAADALCFSLVTSKFIWVKSGVGIKHWEFNGEGVIPRVPQSLVRQLPSEMVKTGTEMMDDFPGEHPKMQRNSGSLTLQELQSELLPRLALLVCEDWVYAGTPDGEIEGWERSEKLSDLRVQITDALVGPF
jgi:hypothetical protein